MKKFITILTHLGLIPSLLAQGGTIKESLTIQSDILGKAVEYSIYLPYDYEESNRSYPILYLLHGFSDDESGWTQFGEVKKIADGMIGNLQVTDMVIAMPDGGVSLFVNSHDGKVKYEDFFMQEFIPHIEQNYRVRAMKRFRAVAGLSMGGHGSLMFALKYPELFSAACPISAAVYTREQVINRGQESYDEYFGVAFGVGLKSESRITEHYNRNSGLQVMLNADPEKIKSVRFYIDCGDDDYRVEGNMEISQIMWRKGIPHEFRVRDGGHNWTYWREALPEVLKFVSQSFHQY